MNEDLLHYIWKFQLFNHNGLKTTEGESVEVIRAGTHNLHSGPDFFNGQVRVGRTKWAGNIEIHTKSSHWFLHKHQEDEAFQKIILHVVWEDDKPVFQENGVKTPTVELKGLVQKSVIEKYNNLQISNAWIPCEEEMSRVSDFDKVQVVERKLIERLESKSKRLGQILSITTNDWEASLFQLLAKYFGFKVNAIPFELLATSINFQVIRKHRNNEKQLLALLFGQAGFLDEDFKGSFPLELKTEYQFLAKKYKLQSLNKSVWKFMRMRPVNFPTIRIAQFVAIFQKNHHLFQSVLESKSLKELQTLFEVRAMAYFDSHFQFDKPASKKSVKNLGKSSVDILLINVVIPLLFNYGKHLDDETIQERAVDLLRQIPAEKNSITKKWKELGFNLDSASDSQALLQLKNEDCSNKKCLTCVIGNSILKPEPND